MKRLSLTLAASSVFLTSLGFPALAQEAPKTETEKLSYVLGMDVGLSLKRIGTEIDLDAFMQALGHVLNDQETLITTQEATQIKQAFVQVQREKQETKAKASAEKNLAEGEAFLAKNKTEEGVVTTDSGLQYRVLEEGGGPKPAATDKVSVHYRGTLLDGTEFDSSYQRGQPATFPLNGVIPGWTEGLQLMPVGGKYKFFIPAQLAYGEKGAGDRIGPNATLIFEVELLEIAQ